MVKQATEDQRIKGDLGGTIYLLAGGQSEGEMLYFQGGGGKQYECLGFLGSGGLERPWLREVLFICPGYLMFCPPFRHTHSSTADLYCHWRFRECRSLKLILRYCKKQGTGFDRHML